MNKTLRLSKSGIEYLNYAWGIFSGCYNLQAGICSVKACWAKSTAKRFKNHYPNGFEPTFYLEALESPLYLRKPSLIGVAWVGDVIGYGLEHKEKICSTIERCPWHTFLFLTKNPEKLLLWSPFPKNCWVGVTATNQRMHNEAISCLAGINAKIKYISYEPLLEEVIPIHAYDFSEINLVILGAQTQPTVLPEIEWVETIVKAADQTGAKMFLKDNLEPIMGGYPIPKENMWAYRFEKGAFTLRQEMP